MTKDIKTALPPLPEPTVTIRGEYAAYTADQMRAYAEQAVLAASSQAVEQDKEAARIMKRQARIGEAIERACRDLPEGWEMQISLEQGAGTVALYTPDCDEVQYETDRDSFGAEIDAHTDYAVAANGNQS